jgi:hypothetical protein
MTMNRDITHLPDTDLIAELARLAADERAATVQLLVHLGEMDRRQLHLALGYRSLVAYGIEVLKLSEDAAFNRVQAARAGRRYPEILDLIERGLLSVTTVRMLYKHLTPVNASRLIAAAMGKTRADVEELLAREFPVADVRPSVRKLPAPQTLAPAPVVTTLAVVAPPPAPTSAVPPPALPPVALVPRPEVRPLAPERYKIAFTATGDTREKLRRAQEMMRHSIPDGDIAAIFDRALTLLLEDLAREKHAATSRPRKDRRGRTDTRHIPAEVKRAVWARDGGCCAFVGPDGHRCGSRSWLEYHHVIPFEAGGQATVENIQLRCRAHNHHESRRYFAPLRELATMAP